MKKNPGPRLPLKEQGRTAHQKPNSTICLQTQGYKSFKNRSHTPQRRDPLAVEKTEPRSNGLKTTYHDHIGGEKYHKLETRKNIAVNAKVNHQVCDMSDAKPSRRFINPSPKIEKRHDYSYFTINNVPRNQSDQEFKSFLSNKGIHPASVKLYKDTITHQNSGKGFLVLNTDRGQTEAVKGKLEANGMTLSSESKLKNLCNN